ncbi:E3 ubiquitin-protein ligase RNF135 [Sylvia atricapilla]|uniref:E3 ubiquitin-protein ligase RNF135 n=1 Tax=Sylvia atricapilla TaxID=48155 RepID=UPI003392BBDE
MAVLIELERLQRVLELHCSCCLQLFAEPVRLSGCGHSFCRGCIVRYCAGRPRAPCPLCRRAFEPRHLRPNRELAALLGLLPRDIAEGLETEQGPAPFAAAACHGRSSAAQTPGEQEEEIWESSKQQEITAETIHLLRKDLDKAKEYTSQIKSQIIKDFCCMKEYVERQERNTLVLIEQEQKAAQQKIEETIHQLTDIKAQPSDISVRQRYGGSPSRINKIILDEKLNVVKSAVEDLKRKLETLLLENYAQQLPPPVQPADLYQEPSVSSSSPEAAAESPEPANSSQFSQWAADVTFDPSRVHKHLALTAQNRRVVVSSQLTTYQPSPKRFCISQVMCSQGFSTGCHYWEVITEDSDGWAVGVAQEMIGKRDKLGRTEHSWCVEWLGPKKQLSAWHKDQETLLHKDKPLKVGVFLELQKKTVSFYSIADQEMLLHTFEVSVSNPLYPAFWLYTLESNGSLTLSQPNRR